MQTTTTTMVQTQEKPMNIVVIGLPGSGKGTQAARLAERYQLCHISSGDLLRQEMKRDTPRGREIKRHMDEGVLFPDELVESVFLDFVPDENYILDGYPRKLSQTGVFKNVNLVIYLTLDEGEAARRILGRRDGRADDNEDAIRVRVSEFVEETKPVVGFYEDCGLLHRVDASGTPDEVYDRVEKIVRSTY